MLYYRRMERPRVLRTKSGIVFPNDEARTRYNGLKLSTQPIETATPYRGEREFLFSLQSGENWRVHLDQMSAVEWDMYDRPHTRSLPRKLKKMVSAEELEDKQRDALYFLHVNWPNIIDLFYTTQYKKRVEPVAFTQVLIGGNSRNKLEFLGFGPDGKVFLFVVASLDRNTTLELERQHSLLKRDLGLPSYDIVTRLVNLRDDNTQMGEGQVSNRLLRVVARRVNGAAMEG